MRPPSCDLGIDGAAMGPRVECRSRRAETSTMEGAAVPEINVPWAQRKVSEFVRLLRQSKARWDVDFQSNQGYGPEYEQLETEIYARLGTVLEIASEVNACLFDGLNVLDGGYAWRHRTQLRTSEILLGDLRDLEERAAHIGPHRPELSELELHPWVWEEARERWEAGQYRDAVQAAATRIFDEDTAQEATSPMGQYVGIDLHRRSTTIVRMAEDGEVLGTERFVSQPFELAQAMAAAGPEPEVVLESSYGWYWAADLLQELGAHVHLAHALDDNWGNRRVKNDERDAQDLAAMSALGRLAEGWIAPPEVRELREARALSLLADPPPHQCQGPDPRGHGQERDPARRRRAAGTVCRSFLIPPSGRPARERAPGPFMYGVRGYLALGTVRNPVSKRDVVMALCAAARSVLVGV